MAAETDLIHELNGSERQSLEALALETDLPLIEVAHLYKVERAHIEEQAKVATFVPLIAHRQVRIKLRHQKH